ncbi:hypothetical protein BZJ19_11360 [Salinivibrio proteolyticus]|uniref:DUF1203 domain-containing protein n=1 Tax=Salinivibrio proteolyticus TaxID=334715 RepID=UPI000988EAF0|nr:DUF1203 domain-containing protein [Salinivibrio proteolyticus]OOF24484.1 hypothetical protein BZJ19_11360 [Salinivibrio proteolyticus]
MNTNFIIKPIEKSMFSEYFNLNDQQLEKFSAKWLIADSKPGFPCRVSLKEAEIGERVLLIPYKYHDVNSPYKASGPIFIREDAVEAKLNINEIPEILTKRLLSVRAYSEDSIMIHAETTLGSGLEKIIYNQLTDANVKYLQVHNANPGCFNCTVYRA